MIPSALPPQAKVETPEERLQSLLLRASPFFTVAETALFYGLPTAKGVLDRIDDGGLRAVDVSTVWPKGNRELRVYRYSVCFSFMVARSKAALLPLDEILLRNHPHLRRDEVAPLLLCTPKHVGNLMKCGALLGRDCPVYTAASVKESLPITFRASLLQFLEAREVRP